jgi:hypothetical protein
LLGYFTLVAEQSNLTLDPDLGSFYTMDAASTRVQEIAEVVAQSTTWQWALRPAKVFPSTIATGVVSPGLIRAGADEVGSDENRGPSLATDQDNFVDSRSSRSAPQNRRLIPGPHLGAGFGIASLSIIDDLAKLDSERKLAANLVFCRCCRFCRANEARCGTIPIPQGSASGSRGRAGVGLVGIASGRRRCPVRRRLTRHVLRNRLGSPLQRRHDYARSSRTGQSK